jgi:hypothetical protein
MSFPGFVTPSALIAGVDNLVNIFSASPTRQIGGIVMDITVEEDGTDELAITEHPVEYGANIADHAYKQPARLVIRAMSSNSSYAAGADPNYATDVYNKLLALQSSGQVFNIQTGKRYYPNMLMRILQQNTDEKTEAALDVRMEFQQIIIAQTAPTAVPPVSQQKNPAQTAGTQNLGTKQLLPSVPIVPPVN